MRSITVLFAAYCLGVSATAMSAGEPVQVTGDAEAGKGKAAVCAACHGAQGVSNNPQWPNLAGQNAKYIEKQLHNFKNPEESGRNNPVMYGQVVNLSDQDMADLAAYFATLPRAKGVADPELAELGRELYRGGNQERGISACIGCHSPAGQGNAAAAWPALSGQHAEYTKLQLYAFRSMERANDPNQMMRSVASLLNDQDIEALATYLQGLRPD